MTSATRQCPRPSLPLLLRAAPVLVIAALCARGNAQESKPNATLDRVEVIGVRDADDRAQATSLKVLVTRDDIQRFGDSSLADVLRRIPGVSVVSTGARAQEVRLRGLGGGYTRIYVNGELMAVGFSVDDLSPDLIERIEIQRSATADTGVQAMAGSIHITLRQPSRRNEAPQLKVGLTRDEGIRTADLGTQFGDIEGSVSRSLAFNLRYDKNNWPSSSLLDSRTPQGDPQAASRVDTQEGGERYIVGAVPRFVWKPDGNRSLVLEGLFQWTRLQYQWRQQTEVLYGTQPEFSSTHTASDTDTIYAQVFGTWAEQLRDGGRLEMRLAGSLSHRKNAHMVTAYGFDSDTAQLLHRTIDSTLEDRTVTFSGKYSSMIADDHFLGLGWSGRNAMHEESRTQRESTELAYPVQSFFEAYDSTMRQIAVYAQYEWAMTKRLSAYSGVRWERLDIVIDASPEGSRTETRASTVSPTMQLIWKIPESKSDQLRISLGRTYKPPTTTELIPRTRVVTFNSAATPNQRGNAQLKPELAWGLDLGYERYLPGDGFAGISAYTRRIQDLILPITFLEQGQWVSMPLNSGRARATGIELELKGDLHQLIDAAPSTRVRVGLARHWSRVEQVPGPGNRLREQPWLTLSCGFDHRVTDSALTWGSSLTVERRGVVRTAERQSTETRDKRLVDLYASWALNKTSKLRLSVLNLLKEDARFRTRYVDDTLNQTQTVVNPSYRSLRILYETSL